MLKLLPVSQLPKQSTDDTNNNKRTRMKEKVGFEIAFEAIVKVISLTLWTIHN